MEDTDTPMQDADSLTEPQPNGVTPDPTPQPDFVPLPSELTDHPDPVPSEQTDQPNSVPSEETAQPDNSVPSEQTAEPNSIPVPSEQTVQPDSVPVPAEPSLVRTSSVTSAPDGVVPPAAAAAAEVVEEERARKKRKIEELGFEKSVYFKMRSIVKSLRPLFLQVSENPNFRETNIPSDILKEITTVLNLSKQLRADLTEPPKPSSIKETNNSTENENLTEDEKILHEMKDVPKNLEDGFKGSYVVGGSPVGWNYLVYPGSKPAYYGRTKAEKLACQIAG